MKCDVLYIMSEISLIFIHAHAHAHAHADLREFKFFLFVLLLETLFVFFFFHSLTFFPSKFHFFDLIFLFLFENFHCLLDQFISSITSRNYDHHEHEKHETNSFLFLMNEFPFSSSLTTFKKDQFFTLLTFRVRNIWTFLLLNPLSILK